MGIAQHKYGSYLSQSDNGETKKKSNGQQKRSLINCASWDCEFEQCPQNSVLAYVGYASLCECDIAKSFEQYNFWSKDFRLLNGLKTNEIAL